MDWGRVTHEFQNESSNSPALQLCQYYKSIFLVFNLGN